jgi:dihydrofolate reductase
MAEFDVVVAVDRRLGIGKGGELPWRLSGDLKFFKQLTTSVSDPGGRNAVIMGRKTWESIPPKRRPLPDRTNIVVTRDSNYAVPEGVIRASSLDDALAKLSNPPTEHCFVIGGGEIYKQAVGDPRCRKIYLTAVSGEFGCDTFFPPFEQEFELAEDSPLQNENGIEFSFKTYHRQPTAR